MIKEGMTVKYKKGYCSDGEEKYLHIVLENRMNPITGEMTRWLIETVNTELTLNPTEVVDEDMIEEVTA